MILFTTKKIAQDMSSADFALGGRPNVTTAITKYNMDVATSKGYDITNPQEYKKFVKYDKDAIKYNPKARTAIAFGAGVGTGVAGTLGAQKFLGSDAGGSLMESLRSKVRKEISTPDTSTEFDPYPPYSSSYLHALNLAPRVSHPDYYYQ